MAEVTITPGPGGIGFDVSQVFGIAFADITNYIIDPAYVYFAMRGGDSIVFLGENIQGTRGGISGGTLTTYERREGGVLVERIEGLTLQANELLPLIFAGGATNFAEWLYAESDVITGTDANDTIYGFDGGDTIDGRAGSDLLVGGDGGDTIIGGSGNDVIRGEAGADVLNGDGGADTIEIGAGDNATGGSGVDRFEIAGNGVNFGATITDFIDGESIIVTGQVLAQANLSATVGSSSATLSIDTDGDGDTDATLQLLGDFTGQQFAVSEGPAGSTTIQIGEPDTGGGGGTGGGGSGGGGSGGGGSGGGGSGGGGSGGGGSGGGVVIPPDLNQIIDSPNATRDILYGTAAADAFVMTDDGQRDLIRDFALNEDVIVVADFAASMSNLTITELLRSNGTVSWIRVTDVSGEDEFLLRYADGAALDASALQADHFIFSDGSGPTQTENVILDSASATRDDLRATAVTDRFVMLDDGVRDLVRGFDVGVDKLDLSDFASGFGNVSVSNLLRADGTTSWVVVADAGGQDEFLVRFDADTALDASALTVDDFVFA